MKMRQKQLVAALLALGLTVPASAIPLIDGLGGARDFGDLAMGRNDDGSSNRLNLPFDINFFGNTYSNFFINTNGNVSFNGRIGTFTPRPFPIASQPMIAPYWGDVDTRGSGGSAAAGGNNVWVASPNSETVVVTWDTVGFYSRNNTRENSFQLVLRDRAADTGTAGDFDIEFRYEQLEWTTGRASGGNSLGLGGTPAQAGYDAGNNTDFFVLPGSRTGAVLDLQNTSNVSAATPGLWSFAIRNGEVPGSTPDNPLMPVETDAGWDFEFGVDLTTRVFIDPDVAIGYDYVVNSGPNVQTVVLPSIGDNLFDIYGWNGTDWDLLASDWLTGDVFDFGLGGTDRFRVMGIETDALLDPLNPTAFVTGLTFAGTGIVNLSQNPITVFVAGPGQGPGASVPEPSILLLLSAGFVLLGIGKRRKQL